MSLKMDSWNHYVLCWDAIILGRPLTGLNRTAWLNDSIRCVSWCCPCSSMTGGIIGTSCMYRTSVHKSTGYSPFRLMMGEECSLPHDVSTAELRTNREHDVLPHPFATWIRDALEVAYDHVWDSLHRTAARRNRLYDVKAVNRKFPVGSWVLRYYPPAAQHKLGSPWIRPNQVVRQATGHTVGIQKGPDKPIVCVHVDDLKLCLAPRDISWNRGTSTALRKYSGFQTGLSR